MANRQVFTLDIETSGLISGYKNAIKQMEQAGVSADVTKGLTSSLKKLEEQYERLSNEGKAGFTNSREIENFKKRVDRLMGSFRGLETSLEKVGGDIGKLAAKSKDAGVKIEKAFNKLGFKNIDTSMKNILQSEDKIKATSTVIEKELSERIKIVDKLSEKYQRAANATQSVFDAAKERTTRVKENGADNLGKSYINAAGNNAPIFSRSNASQSRKNEILNQAAEFIKASQDIEQAWGQMEQYIKTHGLEKYFSGANGANGMAGLRQNMANVFEETSRVTTEESIKIQEALGRQEVVQREVNEATERAREIGKQGRDGTWSVDASKTREIINAVRDRIAAEERLHQSLAVNVSDEEAVQNAINDVINASASVVGNANQVDNSLDNMISTLSDTARGAENVSRTFDNMRNKILSLLSATSVLNLLKRSIKKTYEDVKKLDKAFASIAMVTSKTVEDMWSSYGRYAQMAATLGQKTEDVIKASALFYQQGLEQNEALELTTDTMKLATLAGNDFETATQEMTSAIRGFRMEMNEGAHVTDVYSELAAHAAADVDGIAQAMARTASIANSAGMSFENTAAFLTQVIETTQESAENIGTSLKTIIARFTELKTNVAGTSDSEFDDLDFNKVDTALKSVGVSLKDTQGQFRDLDEVFLELSKKWETLDRNTQRYVATIAAGSRQQSRFIAMMDNYDRTVELMELAANAEGKADEQFAKYADTMEYKLNQLNTTWEQFRVRLMDADAFKNIVDGINELVTRINKIDLSNKFDLGKVVIGLPIAINSIKKLSLQFTKSFQDTTKQVKKLGSIIGKELKSSLGKKFNFGVSKEDVQAARSQAITLKQELDNTFRASPIEIKAFMKVAEDPAAMTDATVFAEKYKQQLINLGVSEEAAAAAVEKLNAAIQANGEETDTDVQKLNNLSGTVNRYSTAVHTAAEKQQKFNARQTALRTGGQIVSTTLNAATISLMGWMNGLMTANQAMKNFGIMAGVMVSQLLLQRSVTLATTAVSKIFTAVKNGESVAHALNAAAIAAETSVTAIWVALIIVAIAVVAILVVGIVALVDAISKEADRKAEAASASSKLAAENERLSQAYEKTKKAVEQTRAKMEEGKKVVDKMTEAEEKYLNQKYLTDEEAEEWLNLQQEIAELAPDLIDHYDEEGNAILKMGTAWDEIRKKKEDYYNEQNKEYTDLNLQATTLDLMKTENDLANAKLQKTIAESNTHIAALQKVTNANRVGNDGAIYDLNTSGNGTHLGDGFYSTDTFYSYTGVGLIQGLIEHNDSDTGKYIRDAIISAGVGDTLGVTSDMGGLDTLHKLEDALSKGNKREEQAALEALQNALEDYPDEVKRQVTNAMQENVEKEGVLDKAIKSSITATTQQSDTYSNASSKNVQMVMDQYIAKEYGLSTDDIKERYNETINSNWFEVDAQGVKTVKADFVKEYNKGFETFLTEELAKINPDSVENELSGVFTEAQQAQIDAFYNLVEREGLSTGDALDKLISQNKEGLISDEVFEAILQNYNDTIEARIKQNTNLAAALGTSVKDTDQDAYGNLTSLGGASDEILEYYNSLGDEAKKAFVDGLGTISNEDGTAMAMNAAQNLAEGLEYASSDVKDYLSKIDWSTFSALNEESFGNGVINELINNYGIAEDKAREYYEVAKEYAKATGEVNLEYVNTAQLASWQETIEKTAEAISKNDDIIKKYSKDNREDIRVLGEDYDKLKTAQEALIKAGVSKELLENALKYDEATKSWILNGKQWNDAIKKSSIETVIIAEEQLAINKAKLEDVNLTNDERNAIKIANEALEKMIESQKELNQHTAATAGYWVSIADRIDSFANLSSAFGSVGKNQKDNGYIGTKDISSLADAFRAVGDTEFDVTRFVNDQMQLNIDTLYEYINAKITEIEVSGQLTEANAEELLMWKAMKKELIATRNEVNAAADALADKATKAQEDYEKQLETITEKQQVLNEKLKDYNDLVYGSDNRKSGLDLLYNYEQAVSSLNDELERLKELLEDSKTREEAYQNLVRYTQATHSYIAEEKARQRVIEQGLANYAAMIESGGASYTNTETGEQINVNFGDYAKKDARTGKYIIDQRLLEESRFTDKYKELIEEQISTYNDYVDKYKESEDKVRKIEKELQEQRQEAVKNYAAMESTIADMLKEQYEKEVDALKEKYEAMKDADDDYLDALQEAIDKQRQLRDQENAWEDLAQKEKKLSLMQRDTSGANELETANLEKEIEDDRQNLLDEAIDNIIDGLSKLYESQQELRDSEVELKDALLENTLYWNSQAEGLAASFTSAEEYAQFLSSLSTEYASLTLAMQQEKLNEYGEEFSQASMYLAMIAMDEASQTGDFIVDTMSISGDEISTIVAETAETFTTEVTRAYNETTEEFNNDLEKAQQEIAKARAELEQAIAKLDELANKAREAAAEVANANETIGISSGGSGDIIEPAPNEEWQSATSLYALVNGMGVDHNALDDISNKLSGDQESIAMINQMMYKHPSKEQFFKALELSGISPTTLGTALGINSMALIEMSKGVDEEGYRERIYASLKSKYRFADGGLVNFTGPAFVDGTPEKPEAFLSAEDTARIGEAAKILADIPWLDRDTNNTSVVTNNGGDVSVEINLNIDHISSDIDIEDMIQRVKDEIVDVAHPEGTNVILQQQLN